ncbi:MAG TPA: hypothetical protein VJ306_08535 [Pyrinomonadaceae bacterium]|jgi:hypothetical protein|nr:hypothetical protein [Pyrinomonadaceae bacterium]
MTSEFSLRDEELTPHRVRATLRAHCWTWKSTGACVGMLGGVIAPLLGLALSFLASFIGDWHGFHVRREGAVLLFLTIPLLIFGAHCLDLLDKEVSAEESRLRQRNK